MPFDGCHPGKPLLIIVLARGSCQAFVVQVLRKTVLSRPLFAALKAALDDDTFMPDGTLASVHVKPQRLLRNRHAAAVFHLCAVDSQNSAAILPILQLL